MITREYRIMYNKKFHPLFLLPQIKKLPRIDRVIQNEAHPSHRLGVIVVCPIPFSFTPFCIAKRNLLMDEAILAYRWSSTIAYTTIFT